VIRLRKELKTRVLSKFSLFYLFNFCTQPDDDLILSRTMELILLTSNIVVFDGKVAVL